MRFMRWSGAELEQRVLAFRGSIEVRLLAHTCRPQNRSIGKSLKLGIVNYSSS